MAKIGCAIQPVADREKIRRFLQEDRDWAIYGLGDLDDSFFPNTTWYELTEQAGSLVLLFTGFDAPVLSAFGETAGVARILEELKSAQAKYYLTVRPEELKTLKQWYQVSHEELMWRMIHRGGRHHRQTDNSVVPLSLRDYNAILELYADGAETGETPDFFSEQMVAQGFFRGVWEHSELKAVAGTHQVVASEGIATVGCVYTRRSCRGQGLGALTTGRVVQELQEIGIKSIGLNVKQSNAAAIAVYQSLGFTKFCPFYEGIATLL